MEANLSSFIYFSLYSLFPSTGARGTDHPPFSNFLFTNLFSIKFLYFFIISSVFPYFTCLCQYSYNLMLTSNCMCRPQAHGAWISFPPPPFLYSPPFFSKFSYKSFLFQNLKKKRGGSREKGGGGNEIHAPCACGVDPIRY